MSTTGTNAGGEQSDFIDVARKRVAKKLNGFTPDFPNDLDVWRMRSQRSHAKDFPVPELVLFTLRNLMGWRWSGHGEKVRWTVYGRVAGEPVAFELRKFGFTILRQDGWQVPQSRIIGQLQRALQEVERLLEPFAQAQVEQGEVLIANRFGEFDSRYHFFRDLAAQAYTRAEAPADQPDGESQTGLPLGGLADRLNHVFRAKGEGFFYSTAMVDSYFSALEHRLVLLRAFTGKPLEPGELLKILAAKWDDKLKAVLPVAGDAYAEGLLNRMRRIKERIRNPFAHGGVENDGGSLFFHLPGVGALPANFSRFGNSVRFSVLPIDADDHAESCQAFNELDVALSGGALAGPHRLMDAGLDPSFDAGTLGRYAEVVASGEAELDHFIEVWSHEWERHANMDY